MKHTVLVALLGLILMSTMSCSESKRLMKGLSYFPQPLGYTLISPIDSSAKTDSVILTFKGFQLDSVTTVSRQKAFILPLLIVTVTEHKYRIQLGANQLQEDYNDFFFDALIDESQRSGRFALCYDSARSKEVYQLEVLMDTCLTDTHFLENSLTLYYFYGYMYSYSESSFPAKSKVSCTLRLRKGDRILKDTTITASSMLAFEEGDNLNRNERLERTAGCMVATLCQSTRDCISKMVEQVNGTLADQK